MGSNLNKRILDGQYNDQNLNPIIVFSIVLPIIGKYIPVNFEFLSVNFSPTRLGVIVVVMLSVNVALRMQKVSVTRQDIGMFLVLFSFLVSIVWSQTPRGSWIAANNSIFHILYFTAAIVLLNSSRDLTILSHHLSTITFVIAIIGLVTLVPGINSRYVVEGAVTYNSYSRDLVALFPLTVLLALSFKKRRLMNVLSSLLMMVLVPMSGSRSGVAGLTVGIALLLIFYLISVQDTSVKAGAFLCIISGVFGALLLRAGIVLGVFGKRLMNIPLTPIALISPDVIGVRYYIYQKEMVMITENWLYGIGYASFFNQYGYMAHNPIGRIWLAAGILPVGVFLYTYYQTLKYYIWSIVKTNNYLIVGFLIGFISLTVAGFFNILLNEPIFYLYFAIGGHTCSEILR